jgi:hypothetical protein
LAQFHPERRIAVMATFCITLVNGQAWVTSDFEKNKLPAMFAPGAATNTTFKGLPWGSKDGFERDVMVRTEHIASVEEV